MTIKIIWNENGSPAGKLADAELHFNDGPLAGLKLIGFGVWERRGGGRNVTFPARQYSVNGLGGHFKTDNLWTVKTDNFRAAETGEFYFAASSVRKSVCTLVRQLRGPHLRTCA